ncbi:MULTISPECIES: hypothetical protein [Streptomyces]|uniref:Uncharacterized protein n=1 Tax=Streptomyces flaveolus TaxID=67297 RepID=A0ABV3A2X2_9ACTN|nr:MULTISPECIES: hypothetical protein [Streptomyces]KMS88710.1 hypothetical protein ACZ91_24540 [Streptomyces regensis]KOG61040.1 hypothetical protein ADK77_33035 [Streptomyces antibioticus]
MRETPDTGRKRIDLNVPQVAGSALAAVVAAKLASYFGVYGTILGAGVVSVVATCGGSVFQHFFKRTGEQLREKTAVAARPPVEREAWAPGRQGSPPPGEFTEGTVYRARARSRRRPLVAAALVFGVTLAGITAYELVSGNNFSGGTGTTVSDAVTGRGSAGAKSEETPAPSGTPSPERAPSTGGGTSHSAPPAPGDSPGGQPTGQPDSGRSGEPSGVPTTPVPTPSAPSPSAATSTPPEPSADSRSGTAGPGPDDPAAR